MFTEKDIQQITDYGLSLDQVNKQIEIIKSGMTYSNLVDTATVGNGILKVQNNYSHAFTSVLILSRNRTT